MPNEDGTHAELSSVTIGIGMVVSDVEQSVMFYADTIGLSEAPHSIQWVMPETGITKSVAVVD
ncbi:MAG: hypothetical protein ACI9D0_001859 [Bacteroidia bacterium]|jgi:hypothetical protein